MLPVGSDLSIGGTVSPNPGVVGQSLALHLTVANAGPDDGTGVTLSVTLPAAASFGSATSGQGTCSDVALIVTCSIGTVTAGAQVAVTINVTPTAPGPAPEPDR